VAKACPRDLNEMLITGVSPIVSVARWSELPKLLGCWPVSEGFGDVRDSCFDGLDGCTWGD